MKTIKRKVLVVVFMLGTLLNYANNGVENSTAVNAKKVKVVFNDAKKGQQLTIKDNDGVKLYAETVAKEGELTKFFDLSSIKNGFYTIELNKEFIVIIKTIEVKDNKVLFIDKTEKVIFKPVIITTENLVKISKTDFDKNSLNVLIYFDDEIILSDTIKGSLIINKVYKLDEKIKGDYRVVVYSNGKNYVNDFKI